MMCLLKQIYPFVITFTPRFKERPNAGAPSIIQFSTRPIYLEMPRGSPKVQKRQLRQKGVVHSVLAAPQVQKSYTTTLVRTPASLPISSLTA